MFEISTHILLHRNKRETEKSLNEVIEADKT